MNVLELINKEKKQQRKKNIKTKLNKIKPPQKTDIRASKGNGNKREKQKRKQTARKTRITRCLDFLMVVLHCVSISPLPLPFNQMCFRCKCSKLFPSNYNYQAKRHAPSIDATAQCVCMLQLAQIGTILSNPCVFVRVWRERGWRLFLQCQQMV